MTTVVSRLVFASFTAGFRVMITRLGMSEVSKPCESIDGCSAPLGASGGSTRGSSDAELASGSSNAELASGSTKSPDQPRRGTLGAGSETLASSSAATSGSAGSSRCTTSSAKMLFGPEVTCGAWSRSTGTDLASVWVVESLCVFPTLRCLVFTCVCRLE